MSQDKVCFFFLFFIVNFPRAFVRIGGEPFFFFFLSSSHKLQPSPSFLPFLWHTQESICLKSTRSPSFASVAWISVLFSPLLLCSVGVGIGGRREERGVFFQVLSYTVLFKCCCCWLSSICVKCVKDPSLGA